MALFFVLKVEKQPVPNDEDVLEKLYGINRDLARIATSSLASDTGDLFATYLPDQLRSAKQLTLMNLLFFYKTYHGAALNRANFFR